MSRIRRISPFEWAYLAAEPAFPPFAIQLLLESDHEIPAALLDEAIQRACAKNRLAAMRPEGRWWVESAPPRVTQEFSEERRFEFARAPLEVIRERGRGLVFRCAHALMDARGLLHFTEEVFRALRGEELRGTSTELSDHSVLRSFRHPRARPWPAPDRRSPVGAFREATGFVHARRVLPGDHAAAGARLAFALARLAWERDEKARIMLPVDLRQLDPSLTSTANYSSPIILELARGTAWEELYRRVLENFARHEYRGISGVDRFVPWLPKSLLRVAQEKLERYQEKRDSFVLSGTVSHVGRVSLEQFRAPGFTAKAIALLPFNAPSSALTLITVQHEGALEISASAPRSSGGEAALASALDRLEIYFRETAPPLAAEPRGTSSLEGKQRDLPEGATFDSLFRERVRLHPEKIVVDENRSYAELDQRASAYAHSLRARGAGPGEIVAVHGKHSFETIAAVLGIARTGAGFLPLDPAWPAERTRFVLHDAGAICAVAEEEVAGVATLWHREVKPAADFPAIPGELAYLLYTSGSSGEPKGVRVGHRSLVNYLLFARETYDPGVPPVYPLFTPLAFDLTLTALLTPLVAGGSLVVIHEAEPASAARAILQDSRINCVKLTPSHLRIFRELGGAKTWIVGGEALDPELARAVLGRLFNEYGPTEATVGCVVHEYKGDSPVPIGHPIPNSAALLLDDKAGPVPPGAHGELYLSGECLALGYHNRPSENARFSPHPFRSGETVYRTGDRARLENGMLFYAGRVDDQLKIRGHRVEPGEVEAALLATGLCREAAAIDDGGELIAFVSGVRDEATLARALAGKLPPSLLPARYEVLEKLPLTANGKVDKRALPRSGKVSPTLRGIGVRGIAEELAGRALPANASLHDLGFDSLKLALLLTRASRELSEPDRLFRELSPFLKRPTLENLEELLGRLV